tara:strand:+ start:2172 stop:4646 length:2475 start_codon:yes stop_codon:yes gene_type:complete
MLSPYTVTIYTKQDNPFNVIPDAPIEIRERLSNGTSGSLSIIYSDQEGLIPITQTGAKADSNGQFTFYAEAAQYNAVYESQTVPVDTGLTADTLPSAIINNLSIPHVFGDIDDYKSSTTSLPDGKQVKILSRGATFTKISGVLAANSHNIVANNTLLESIELNIGKDVVISQWIDSATDAESALPIADTFGKRIIIDTPIATGALADISSFVEFTTEGTITGDVTFTFKGNISGNTPRSYIFVGTNDIVIGGMARQVYPEWFGILTEAQGNDGSVNLDFHGRRAGRSIIDSQCDILFGDGKYFIRDFLLDGSNCGMKGAGKDRTFLENSTVNNVSTRLGVFVSIFAPHSAYIPQLGNRDWDGVTNSVISDCHISDMTLIWDDTKTVASDPLMNCLAVLGCQGGTVKRVHAVLPTGQRAFAVQTHDVDQKTEDILFTECSSVGSLVGIYISEGFADNNSGKSFKNIQVINNHFSVRLNPSSASGDTSTPIFFHGGERPENIDAGIVTVRDNHCEGGARGAGSGSAGEFTRFNSKVVLDNNHFVNFREHGTILYMEDIEITNNVYDSTVMETDVIQAAGIVLKTQLAHAAAITGATQANPVVITSNAHQFTNGQKVQFDSVLGMVELNGRTFTVSNSTANTYELLNTDGTGFTAYTSSGTASHFGGTRRAVIRGNKYKRLSGAGTIYGTQIDPLAGMSVLLDDNHHIYSDLKPPVYDLFAPDGLGITCDIKASNNVFYDTGAANVRVTTVNQEMLLWDLGGNEGMNLFNGEIYGVRFSAPVDSRYYKRGTQLSFGIPLFTAGTQVGYMATADHTPTNPAVWKNIIG